VQPSELTRLVSFVLLSLMIGHSCKPVGPAHVERIGVAGVERIQASRGIYAVLNSLGAQLAKPRNHLARSAIRHRN
jgi:hypothetical protein